MICSSENLDRFINPPRPSADQDSQPTKRLRFRGGGQTKTAKWSFTSPRSLRSSAAPTFSRRIGRIQALSNPRFVKVLDETITVAAGKAGYPKPQFFVERVKHLNTWHAPSYNIIQPNGLPYFHFQMNAPLSEHPEQAAIRTAFSSMSDQITAAVDAEYAGEAEHRDLNSADDYRPQTNTILQSTAARTITDPVLSAVRQWLEKKKTDAGTA